jgi:hypothetical protein
MRAFLDEEADHGEVDYFQGLGQFREQGLPCQLPAAERNKLLHLYRRREMIS